MRKRLLIGCLCLSALSMMAQTNEPTSAGGYDFYFTLFNHWGWSGNSDANNAPVKYCGFTVCATEAGDMTLSVPTSTGDKFLHFDAYNYLAASLKNVSSAVLQGVHFHSTAACFLHVWAHGGTSGAETMILPKHLLGTKYMLQGVSGGLIESEGTMVPTYSQFTVVGTENYTNVVVTPKVQLRCVSRENAIIPAGSSTGLFIQENEVLLFQPDDYTKDISGTRIESDKVVAVFQGNNLTRIPYGENWSDYTWEQALPTDTWGKEFIVPKSHRAPYCLCQITALYDNTTVYYYINGNKQFLRTLSAGETLKRTSNLPVEHFVSDQPICCYLYNEGATVNDGVGDPTMVAIVPMDNMATETRWMLEQVEDNSPYKFSLLVTTRLEDESKVKYNNTPLSSYQPDGNSVYRTVTDGFVTYEMGISAYMASKLIAEDGAGFSAYILRIGNTAEASAFNISMPFKMPPDFCPDGALLFKEDFGGNDPSDPVVSHRPVSGMSSKFTQIYDTATCKGSGTGCVGMGSGRYLVAKHGFRNSSNPTYSVWHIMDDHTSFGDTTTGYFLEIDGRETDKDPFFSTTMDGLCSGMELSFSTYVANVTTAGQYNAWRTGRGYVHPQLTFLISDPMTGAEIARYNTDTISHDWSLFGVPNAWKQTANWQQVGMKFTVPDGISRVKLTIQNNAYGSTGNDFALDDIEVRLCMPPVSITAPDTVCWGNTVQLQAEQAYPYMISEPLFYLWEFSTDSITWTTVQNSMSDVLNLNRFQETNAGWYRVSMGTEDRVGSENCRSNSEPVRVEVKLCLPPVTIQAPDTVCVDTKNIFTALFENGGVMDEPLQYFWEFSADSITWTVLQTGEDKTYSIDTVHRADEGWYRVAVANSGQTSMPNCRSESEPFRLNTMYCNTATDRFIDTVVCDTLLPITWRAHTWPETGTRIDTIRDIDVDDSIYVHLHLDTVTCCPEIVHVRVDSAVCDTLTPFLWFYQDTMVLFNDIGAQEIEYTHYKWIKCTGEIHTLVLDTFHCERLYPIIVNKYNWQLLLDHVSLRHFFPGYTPLRYQWYCDSVAIPGATEDDYAERNELHGHFQLYVELDQDEHAWSNVIDLSDTPAPKPVTHRIYNAQGLPVSDDQLTHGVYLIVYQQGDRIWTEKRFVP